MGKHSDKENVRQGNPIFSEDEESMSVIDAAAQLGKQKPYIFKVLNRLSIEPTKQRGGARNRGQSIAYITMDEFHRLQEHFESANGSIGPESDANGAAFAPLTVRGCHGYEWFGRTKART